jgi:hypothetical protein
MTLAEFLLARIGDDEADLRDPSGADYCDALTGAHYSNERIRAECDAKRRIVALHNNADEGHDCTDGWHAPHGFRDLDYDDGPCETLRLLALPYADHPDYREEWKP